MTTGSSSRKRRSAFGSIKKLPSGRYLARYTAPDGTPRAIKGTFDTKTDADAALYRIRVQQQDRVWLDPLMAVRTLREYLPEFTAARRARLNQPIKPKTQQLTDWHLREFILPAFGGTRLDRITTKDVRDWLDTVDRSHAVRRQAYSLLRAILSMAVRDGLIRENPCKIVGAGSVPKPTRPHMTLAQAETIVDAMSGPERLAAEIAFHTQMRMGEILALRWMDVDLDAGTIHVCRSVTESYNQQVESTTKSGTTRLIGLDAEAVALFDEVPRTTSRARVVVRADGGVMRHWHVTTAWERARKLVDLEHFRFHDLRHAGLTALAYEGLPIQAIMNRAGHSTIDAALNYQHVADALGQAHEAFANAKARARGSIDRPEAAPRA